MHSALESTAFSIAAVVGIKRPMTSKGPISGLKLELTLRRRAYKVGRISGKALARPELVFFSP